MIIRIELSSVPPVVELLEADDLRALEVRTHGADHAWVAADEFVRLAGPERAADPEWRAGLEKMLAYAAEHGWVREEDGAVRAHVVPVD